MDEISIKYTHPEHGELLVKARVLSKGEVRIHTIKLPGFWGAWASLHYSNGAYHTTLSSTFSANPLETLAADLANSGVLNALLATECLKWAKRLNKAAVKLQAVQP